DLGTARPYALWVRGTADLRVLCDQSVSVIGSRAATAYGPGADLPRGGALAWPGDDVRRAGMPRLLLRALFAITGEAMLPRPGGWLPSSAWQRLHEAGARYAP
ncbi:MAG: hypothetical protein ABJB47_05105, partial [Actinomycetota bacterium]